MRHTSMCPLRWADLDELGHVNNVVFVDYLQEARVELLRELRPAASTGSLDEAATQEASLVVRHEIDYVTPLVLGRGSLHIECWVVQVRGASFTLAYELFHPGAGPGTPRTVYARATTLLTPYVFATGRPRRLTAEERAGLARFTEDESPTPPPPRPEPLDPSRATTYELKVRFSDVDVYRHVNNVKYVEYLQEARIAVGDALWRVTDPDPADPDGPGGGSVGVVVGRTEVDYHRPMVLRVEPYVVLTAVSRVGNRSMELVSEVRDGDELCARGRVVLVFIDRAHGRSVEPSPATRARLQAALERGLVP